MLGSAMVARLRRTGHEALSPDPAEVDLLRPDSLEAFFRSVPFDGLVNCAAFTAVDDCENPAKYPEALKVNGEVVGVLGRLCRTSSRWLVHLSTDYVFNGRSDRPYREEDSTDPLNAYGRTKWEGEKAFRASGVEGWIVRTSWLYGPQGRHFVRTMARLLREKPKVEVVEDQVGGPTFTHDLAAFILDLVETRAPYGLYHFSNEGHTSWFGFACAIRDELGLKTPVLPVTSDQFPRPALRPGNSRFDLAKARSVARTPIRPWRDALKEYLAMEKL
jgi:dTDP-4-dehydrorhamnose reductase